MAKALLLCNDLFFCSRIKAAAKASEVELKVAISLASVPNEVTYNIVVVDLAASKDSPQSVADHFKTEHSGPQLIAFGPHVQAAKLEAAKSAGFDQVLTRGQLDRNLQQLFA